MTAPADVEPAVTIEPGVREIGEQAYHRHVGSLSCSGAKKLLAPSCPARFRYEQDNPPAPSDAMELGTAAHKLVLGVGPDLVEIPFDEWRTNEAKAMVAETRARGAVPLKPKDMRTVEAMALALHQHPAAHALLANVGTPEASLFAVDEETGILLRGRLDNLPPARESGRMIVGDYKTSTSAHPYKFAKSAADYRYFMQAPWYVDLIRALGLAEDVAFVFIVQETTPPYLVSVIELEPEDIDTGRTKNREAIDIYARCVADNHWPSYADDVVRVALPRWIA